MSDNLDNMTFEEWIKCRFDQSIPDLDICDKIETISSRILFMTNAFENAGSVFAPFSDTTLNAAFWEFIGLGHGEAMYDLLDDNLPWIQRKQSIHSIFTLFDQLFAIRCSDHLSHLDESSGLAYLSQPEYKPLNSVCYMWWDIVGICGEPLDPVRTQVGKEFLNIMTMILTINSVACQESALHGLGHWEPYFPRQVTAIIENYLTKNPGISRELAAYALAAGRGHIM